MAQTTNNIIQTPKALSILVSLDGLSFCVLSFGKISLLSEVSFEKQLNPIEVLERLKKALSKEQLISEHFEKVTLTISNELFTCVPEALFNKNNLTNYLKFSSKLLKTDFADVDALPALQLHTVYIPFTNITNFIYDQFGAFTYRHSISVFAEAILAMQKEKSIAVNLTSQYFELVVIQDNALKLANRFTYSSKEDFIYYILFTYEQLNLDREEDILYVSGLIEEGDDNYEMAFKYIRHIAFLEYSGYESDTSLELQPHQHLLIRQALI